MIPSNFACELVDDPFQLCLAQWPLHFRCERLENVLYVEEDNLFPGTFCSPELIHQEMQDCRSFWGPGLARGRRCVRRLRRCRPR